MTWEGAQWSLLENHNSSCLPLRMFAEGEEMGRRVGG